MIYFVGLQHEMQELVSNDVYSIATIDSVVDYFKEHKEIQVDTETEGFDTHTANLKCFQLGDYHNQFVIQYSKDNFNAIKHYLEDSSIVKIFQNAKFDLRFFLKQGIIIHNVYDTFLAESSLFSSFLGSSLAVKLLSATSSTNFIALSCIGIKLSLLH